MRRNKEALHERQIPTGLFLPNMSDCSAWDVTPQNNSGNVKKCKKTPRKNSTAFCRRFPRVQIPLFAICRDVSSFGTRTPSWSSSPVGCSTHPAQRTSLGQNGDRASSQLFSAARGFPRCAVGAERERHASDSSLSERERRTSCRPAAARCWPCRCVHDEGSVLELTPGRAHAAHFCFVHKRPEEQRLLVRSDLPALK